MSRRLRRLAVALAVTVLVLALGGAAAWFWWVPHYRPSLRAGESYGIDVSHHQGEIDWKRVAADGVHFAYIKSTEGADHVDPRYVENWTGSALAGLDRAPYHFFTLCRPGVDQAHNFLGAYIQADLPPAVDLELAGNCAARPSRADVERELLAFLDVVEEDLEEPMVLYVGDDWRAAYGLPPGERPLWLRRVLRRPPGDWAVWQVMGNAAVDGIEGPVDLNVMRLPRPPAEHGTLKITTRERGPTRFRVGVASGRRGVGRRVR